MLDKYIIKTLEAIDNFCDRITDFLFAPRCKCGKKKKKDAQTSKKMGSSFKNVVRRFKRTSW